MRSIWGGSFGLFFVVFFVAVCGGGYAAGDKEGTSLAADGTGDELGRPAAANAEREETAAGGSGKPLAAMLSSLVLTVAPSSDFEKAARSFSLAEDLRERDKRREAVLAYISLIDSYPSSSQAVAADARANYIMHRLDPARLDALGATLPAPETLKSLAALTILGQYHYLCAGRAAESSPERAAQHIQILYELAWRAFEEDLDDDYKLTVLTEYLKAADMLGKGKETRAALSAHAESLPWSFTRWLIKTEIDGAEPPARMVPSQEGLESVRKYYLLKGRAALDPEMAEEYYTKCRDLAQELLTAQPVDKPRFDLAHVYLEAADALGPEKAGEAVDFVERYLESKPLSIMCWIVRYELAVYLTRQGAIAEQARRGFVHYENMLAEADTGLVEPVVRDSEIDPEIRGLLACVWGHAFAGTNQPAEAALFYDWVLECCPRETHPGSSAAYAKAVMYERQNRKATAACVATYEKYVRDHPSSFYAPEALLRVGDILKEQGDFKGAREAYERVTREYEERSASKQVHGRIAALRTKEGVEEQP